MGSETRYPSAMIAVVVFSVSVLGRWCNAAPVLDQYYNSSNGIGSSGYVSPVGVAQVFTVGLTGELTGVDLALARPVLNPLPSDTVTVELRPTTGGVPDALDSSVIALIQVPFSYVPYWTAPLGEQTHFDFSPFDLQVTAGEQLAVDVGYSGEPNVIWALGSSNLYSRGSAYSRNGFNRAWSQFVPPPSPVSMYFQTYVDTAAVPEPGGIVFSIAIIGLLLRPLRKSPVRGG
jgi:hypothetical protein